MSWDDVRRIADTALRAAEAASLGKQHAVVVIVAEIGPVGSPVSMATNIVSGREHVIRLLTESANTVRGGA